MADEAKWSEALREFVERRESLGSHDERIFWDEYYGEEAFNKFALIEKATSWKCFLKWLDALDGSWCFRGQREAV
jgi:hypothetical protein